MDPRAGQDLWGEDPTARYSSSYAPFGKIDKVKNGYRLSGRWEWSSGSDHCSWVMLGGILMVDDHPQQLAMLVPRADYQVIDNWHVAGLKGTGSNDILVEDAFVPEHRVHFLTAPSQGAYDASIYDLPFNNVFALCLCAVTQGIAEGALAAYTDYLRTRMHKYDGRPMATDPFQQRLLSEASAVIQSNRQRFHSVFRRLEAALVAEPVVPADIPTAELWETQVIAHLNADWVTRLMRASGGGAQRLSHPMQRYFRDINAAVAHAFLNADRGSMQFAKTALGLS